MKKILSIILSAALMLGAVSAAYAAGTDTQTAGNASYTDLKATNWAYEAVNAMNGKGIVKGYPDGSFKPQGVVTYGEFIKMALIAATGEDAGNAPSVSDSGEKPNWASNYYSKGLELKYFGETAIKDSQLNQPIPRGDMALILSNILGETKIDNYAELEESLSDVNSTVKNDYDIIKVYAKGLITGYQDGTFKPENTLTRAESATVIYRLTDESKRVLPNTEKEEPLPEVPVSGTDIGSVIKNYKTFEQADIDAGQGSVMAEATKYEIITDMSAYKVEAVENRGTKWIDINGKPPLDLGWGNMYLMKGNEIVQMTQNGGYDDENRMKEHIDITTIDYFVFTWYKGDRNTLGLMPNPLYKN